MRDDLRKPLLWAARLAFVGALCVTFWFAFAPPGHGEGFFPWDKANHILAFFVLTGLALVAFPRVKPAWLALALSAVGALIEAIQGLPFVHRDCDIWDWVADSCAILAVMAVATGAALRRWLTLRG